MSKVFNKFYVILGFTNSELQDVENASKHIVVSWLDKMSGIFRKAKSVFMSKSDFTSHKLMDELFQSYSR